MEWEWEIDYVHEVVCNINRKQTELKRQSQKIELI